MELPPAPWSDDDFRSVAALVKARHGAPIPAHRLGLLRARLRVRLMVRNIPSFNWFYENLLRGHPDGADMQLLIDLSTVNHTSFFREPGVLEPLADYLVERLRSAGASTIRVWSAGCSAGQEPFSLAMLLAERLPLPSPSQIEILASDISLDVLQSASRAIYETRSLSEISDERLRRFFLRGRGARHGFCRVSPEIRRLVTFRHFSLKAAAWPVSQGLDAVLCRNVLIYLSRGAIERLALRFHHSLAPQGWLIVAPSELSQSSFGMFETVNFPAAVLYRKSEPSVPRVNLTAPTEPDPMTMIPPFIPQREMIAPSRPIERKPPPLASLEEVREILKRPADESTRRIEDAAVSGIIPVYYWAARVLADRTDWVQAQRWIEKDLVREPLSARSHFLHGLILGERGMLDAAAQALRRCVYADRSFVLGHVALADLLDRSGEQRRSASARQTALDLLASRADHEWIAEGDGLTVGRLRALLRGRST